MRRVLGAYGLYLAWLVALVATGGSLYFSEVRHFIPCQLCWFQRILMYPLILVVGIASYRQDRQVGVYVLPLSGLGFLIALFHYLEQKVPGFGVEAVCRVGVPCTTQYINWLGFITIPFLSLTAFALITLLVWAARRAPDEEGASAPA